MRYIELMLDTRKPVMINTRDISYVFQNQKGYGVIVMRSGVDLHINEEYGNLIAMLLHVRRKENESTNERN